MRKWQSEDKKPSKKKRGMTTEEFNKYLADGLAVLAKDWNKPDRRSSGSPETNRP